MRVRAATLAVAVLTLASAATTHGADVPISGRIKFLGKSAEGRRVYFSSNDPAIVPALAGTPDAPTTAGMRVELWVPEIGWPRWAPPAGWRRYSSGAYRFPRFPKRVPRTGDVGKAIVGTHRLRLTTTQPPILLAGKQREAGIAIVLGSTRYCAWFDGDDVVEDRRKQFEAVLAAAEADCGPLSRTTSTTLPAGSTTTSVPGASTTSTTLPPGECGDEDTLHVIQDRIFNARGCATSTCHGAFNISGLDLRPGSAYWNLVDVAATNASAAAAGKKRVVPGDPEASFLVQKLAGDLTATEGARMPSVGRALTPVELAVVAAWIAAGAPSTGIVPAAPCLPAAAYEPAPALPVPAGGYQLVLNGPTLQPGQEQEGCLWVRTPNTADFATGRWEFSLNPGTHHFAVFEWNKTWAPATGIWNANDFGCFSGAEFGNNISGSPQAPYYVDAYPTGVARLLPAGKYLGLNAHYYNEFDAPIQVKVWINIYPYAGTAPAFAKTIVDIDDTFNISIPPYTANVYPPPGAPRARWTNTSSKTWAIIDLGGHMHSRGVRFTAWDSHGAKLYESYDWSHPNARYFTPSLDLLPGDYIDYECFYDNGVERPVRTNAYGDPATLTFGTSAEDAMCILTGQYYPK